MPFRTTISAVFWTDTAEEAEAAAETVAAAVVDEAQDSVLVQIEYKAERPEEGLAVPPVNGNPESETD